MGICSLRDAMYDRNAISASYVVEGIYTNKIVLLYMG